MTLVRRIALSCMLVATAAIPSTAGSQTETGVNRQALEPLPRELEISLALSAAPPYLRSAVAVYVLDPAAGYLLARTGSNGFTCYVQRTDYTRAYYSDRYIVPECQDAEGTRSIVPVEFDVERLRAEGRLSPDELKLEILQRFKDGVYHSPSRPGVAYMLAPVAQLNGGPIATVTVPVNMPHFMFFAPNLSSGDIGGGPLMGPYPYIVNSGPMGYVIVNVGDAEKARINRDSQSLLKEACSYRSYLCLGDKAAHDQHHQ